MGNCIVQLKCYPVCECGYVFTNFEIIRNQNQEIGEKYSSESKLIPIPVFNPQYCPKCTRLISGVEIKSLGSIPETLILSIKI